ncbi:hypothetical protein M758_6G052200 [Ceratodon purpureus]|uniref:Uncharacterized protein n=1 Tax=Ceratodon purpureus TaxID=3225 RepID=A0A8T0HFV3_CERPU|nr:hypothetical protein KC19_6G055100 [Ceratodon purpureus]KAG0612788.1 hypothetical protein M758_6G052200 [Ceratodon purpureus]
MASSYHLTRLIRPSCSMSKRQCEIRFQQLWCSSADETFCSPESASQMMSTSSCKIALQTHGSCLGELAAAQFVDRN